MDPHGVGVQSTEELQRLAALWPRDVDVEEELADRRARPASAVGFVGVRVGAGGHDVGEPGDGNRDLLAGLTVTAAENGTGGLVQGALDDGVGLGRADLGRGRHFGDLEVVLL